MVILSGSDLPAFLNCDRHISRSTCSTELVTVMMSRRERSHEKLGTFFKTMRSKSQCPEISVTTVQTLPFETRAYFSKLDAFVMFEGEEFLSEAVFFGIF